MNSEGRGIVPPEPVWIPISRAEFIMLKERATQQAIERDYKRRRDSWGRGLTGRDRPPNVGDIRDPDYSILLGLIGEWGVCQYINQRLKSRPATMDLSPRKGGDFGVDLSVNGLTIQVKTQQNPVHPGLIRCVTEYGENIHLRANCYAFTRFDRDRPEGIYILGWVWSKVVAKLPSFPALRGNHMNIEVPSSLYLPASRLVRELRQREEVATWR